MQYESFGTSSTDFYGDRRITRGYDTATGVVGRYNVLSTGPAAGADYSVSYGYDGVGRINSSWYFNYTYVSNSHLISSVASSGWNYTDARAYESAHDWTHSRTTTIGSTTKAAFTYTQDNMGRITQAAKTGEVYSRYGNGTEGLTTYYGYDDRSQLTKEITKVGTSATVLTGRDDSGSGSDGYTYDNIGNRTATKHNSTSTTASYTVNALNQYTQRTVPGVIDIAGAVGTTATIYTDGVSPARHGQYFFQNFVANGTASARVVNSILGVTPQVKSLNGVYSFNWQNLSVTTPTVTGPAGTSVQVLEFDGSPWHVGMDVAQHGYTFQNGHNYVFGFWARTTSGTRNITPMLTDDGNSGVTSSTYAIDTSWRWVTVTKAYASVGSSPRIFYTWDSGGANFQVYGAQVADVTDPNYATSLSAFVASTPEAMAYDDDGNYLSDGRWSYTYDAENRLITAETIAAAVTAGVTRQKLTFAYDYLGRRVSKLVQSGWNGSAYTTTDLSLRYFYDGWNMLFELNAASLAKVRGYVWGLDLSGTLQGAGGVGGLLVGYDWATGNTYLPAYDAMGNIHGMIKASDGTLAAAYEYDAFGNTLRESGPYAASNPFRFATKYADLETGLVQYNTRYYSPSLGRFLNRDSIEEEGGLNLYGYCGNNAVNHWDMLGMADPIAQKMGYDGDDEAMIDWLRKRFDTFGGRAFDNSAGGNSFGLATADSLMFSGLNLPSVWVQSGDSTGTKDPVTGEWVYPVAGPQSFQEAANRSQQDHQVEVAQQTLAQAGYSVTRGNVGGQTVAFNITDSNGNVLVDLALNQSNGNWVTGAPNSTLPSSADIIAGGGLLAANGNASVADALRQKALLAAQRVYGEVGSLRPTQVEGPGDPNSLFEVMQRIAGIAYETPTRVAAPLVPDLRNPQVRDIFADIQGAVDTRISPGADRHFVIYPSADGGKTPSPGMSAGWPYSEANKITTVYGPFQNTASKNAPDRYVFIYTGVK